ncbi:MAG: ubiquinone/menaquinone biosynthesis C-methylase UbiE [Oceanospirillaceae bacterium]|jgi:ubiquinone/menaquinone biosynthesis C-methylase UbiE
MSINKAVTENYHHGELLTAIETALTQSGKTPQNVSIEDLAAVDEFHLGGRAATDHLLTQLSFPEQSHILDVGCGLGGAARYVAKAFNHSVVGLDLSLEYIETGNALCQWVDLEKSVTLEQGSALSMSFNDEAFAGGYMLHVGMNIADKGALFKEVSRVLKPKSFFGIYDIMRQNDGTLTYPVPWASQENISQLATIEKYKHFLEQSGFEIVRINDRREFALQFFQRIAAKKQANEAPAPLGLHVLMQQSTAQKIKNMIGNVTDGLISPVEIIVQKIS